MSWIWGGSPTGQEGPTDQQQPQQQRQQPQKPTDDPSSDVAFRERLIAVYKKYNPIKINDLDKLIAQHDKEELWSTISKKYLSETIDPKVHNPTLIPELRYRDIFYSGYVTQLARGWLDSNQRRWMVLTGKQLRFFSDPCDKTLQEVVTLKGAELHSEPLAEDSSESPSVVLTLPGAGDYTFLCSSEEERMSWAVSIQISIVQANVDTKVLPERCQQFLEFLNTKIRPCLPLPHHLANPSTPPRAQGYLVSHIETDSIWSKLGGYGDWKRRWVEVHEAWYTLRDEKGGLILRVVPLRDADVVRDETVGEDNKCSFSVNGPLIPELVVCLENIDLYRKWKTTFIEAVLTASRTNVPPEEITANVEEDVKYLESK